MLRTHVFICGLLRGDEVWMEAGEADHRPDGEEADDHLDNSNNSQGNTTRIAEQIWACGRYCTNLIYVCKELVKYHTLPSK